jgi:hypothetical protein
MFESFHILFILGLLAAIVVGGYFAHRAAVRRQEELRALAARLGWQYDPGKDSAHDDRYGHFSVFKQGGSRYAYNTLRGPLVVDGQTWRAQMGDYHYTTTSHNGKTTTTQTHRFSYLIVTTPFVGTPELTIRREHLFHKIGGFLGFDDIDFESAEFSGRFHVKSTDKRYAYDVVHPRMMEFLLNGDPPIIDVAAGEACFFRTGKTWSAAQFANVLSWSREFFELWPRHIQSTLENQSRSG